ncbi:hypothetical protein GS597_12965 [Synechococcales cyanobacterium C]|uniref:Uncharacterized protein n=1 Tax=Petrachloros mirabilis ULC683 TaxID=2781853 RepID=A0A8K2A111_9CYAN|nr:hypothetical protein [Petrachloros mirabilis]NCJ07402.1 hypothetical protein [Petrachloros mirabilis ULC683]
MRWSPTGLQAEPRLRLRPSPYEGTVKKIKWLNQVNQELTVEITLATQELAKVL